MKKKRISSKVASELTSKLEAQIRDNIGSDVSFVAHVSVDTDRLYELDCDVTIQYTPEIQDWDEPPQAGKVLVACDTFSLTAMDEEYNVEHYNEVAERIINEVINLI